MPDGPRVLVVAWDAAEVTLVRRLLDAGRLPHLAGLLARGSWYDVDAGGAIASGAVWPSFATGTAPRVHGVTGEWRWNPDRMALERYHGEDLRPFWGDLAARGLVVGMLDVSFVPLVGMTEGFEILEWGSQDLLTGRTHAGPEEVARLLGESPVHPLAGGWRRPPDPGDAAAMTGLAGAMRTGMALRVDLVGRLVEARRPDVVIVHFSEPHFAGHHLWHTHDVDHPLHRAVATARPTLEELYEDLDHQLGRLLRLAEPGTPVLVAAMHGMTSSQGVPTLLHPLLVERSYAAPATLEAAGPRDRAVRAAGWVKRHVPEGVRDAYRVWAPHGLQRALAAPTMMPPLDWSRTRAFSLYSDQQGRLRINLRGRERDGLVDPAGYDALRGRLEAELRELADEAGAPLVRSVVRPSDEPNRYLPDLVIRWAPAAFADPVRVAGTSVASHPTNPHLTGQHTDTGFAVWTGLPPAAPGALLEGWRLHELVEQACAS